MSPKIQDDGKLPRRQTKTDARNQRFASSAPHRRARIGGRNRGQPKLAVAALQCGRKRAQMTREARGRALAFQREKKIERSYIGAGFAAVANFYNRIVLLSIVPGKKFP
jgi:hypothetical protein